MLRRLTAPVVALVAVLLPQEVSFMPRLVAGDAFQLQVKHTREDTRRPSGSVTSTWPVAVRVVSRGPTGIVLEWKPGSSEVVGASQVLSDPTMTLASEIFDNITIRAVLDPDGAFEKIENSQEMVSKVSAMLDAVLAELTKDPSAETTRKARELVKQIFTPENLINLATRDVQTWAGMHGVELAVNKPLEAPLRQPNPFGGEPLSAVLRLRVESASATTATLVSETVYETESLKKSAIALLERAAAPGTKPLPQELASFRLEISDEGRYVFDRRIGLFKSIIVTRRAGTSAGPAKAVRTDRYEITLTTPPKR